MDKFIFFDFCKKFFNKILIYALFLACFNKNCNAVLPMHLQLMCHPSKACTDEWRPTVSTLCPFSLPCRKAQEVGRNYAQNKAQMNHPQRIS